MIINLTQHAPTAEQAAAGVGPASSAVQALLTFGALPTREEIQRRAEALADHAAATLAEWRETVASYGDGDFDSICEIARSSCAMIGGAPYLMSALEAALMDRGITPLYAFSERVTEEATQPDGSVRKINVFRHVGFVEA